MSVRCGRGKTCRQREEGTEREEREKEGRVGEQTRGARARDINGKTGRACGKESEGEEG